MGLFITSQVMDSWSRGISTSPDRSSTPAAGEHQHNHPGHALLQQENINITSQIIDPFSRGNINITSQIIDPFSRGNINVTSQVVDSCSKRISRSPNRSWFPSEGEYQPHQLGHRTLKKGNINITSQAMHFCSRRISTSPARSFQKGIISITSHVIDPSEGEHHQPGHGLLKQVNITITSQVMNSCICEHQHHQPSHYPAEGEDRHQLRQVI
jgi:hypothetical protein